MEQFVVKVLQDVFQNDALESTRPMNENVGSPSEVLELFNKIAYAKGTLLHFLVGSSFVTQYDIALHFVFSCQHNKNDRRIYNTRGVQKSSQVIFK